MFVLHELVTRLLASACWKVTSWLIPDLAEVVSAPQTTPMTANKCGNIFVLPRCDDRPNQFLWLKLLHASYFFPLKQVHKDRVLYSVDKNFETKGDSRNFCDEQILKMWTPCLSALRDLARGFRIVF